MTIGTAYYDLASIYALRGDHEKALEYLFNVEESGVFGAFLDYIKFDAFFDGLRDDERFKELIKRQDKKYADIRAELDRLEKEEGF